MLNLLTPYGIPEISIITGLAVAAIILITLNIVFIVRATRKPTEQDEHVVYVPVPAPVEEPQPQPEPEPQPVAVVITDTTPEQEEMYNRLRLDKSFTAKLVQTEEETKQLYAELKRELLSYTGVHARMSWRRETYTKSREVLARFGVRGKTLCLYLALQPEEFADSKYKAEDASGNSSYADTPLMYRIKNPLRMRHAKELIAYLMAQRGLEKGEFDGEDPMVGLEYRSTPVLIDEGLIRVPAGMELPVFTEPVPAPQPEVVEEIAPVEEPQPVAVVIADTTPEQEEMLDRLKLDKSFTAKLVQTEEETKQLYAELKRELLSYTGVHARMSWRRETYTKSREVLARFGVRGKTLCLYLALRPEEFADSKYKAEDASGNSSYADTPLMYRIKNPLRMRHAKELIAYLMAQRGLEKGEFDGEDPMVGLEYRSTPVLIDEGLIRVPAGMELPVFTEPVPAPQPEVVEEIAPVEEPQPEPVPVVIADTTPEQEEMYNRLKLDKSFTAKLVQTEEETKQLYAELKRELLSYTGVHARMSWRRETYTKSREVLARFGVRGKTLCLYLALQPEEFADSKYKAEDASGNSSYADTPLMYRIKNPLRMRHAKELIAYLMAQRGLEKGEFDGEDPMVGLEYRSTPVLIDEGLIRVPAGMELPVFTEPVPAPQPEVVEEVSAEPVEEAETASAEAPVAEEPAAEEVAESEEAAGEPAEPEEVTEEPAGPEDEFAASEAIATEPEPEETAEEPQPEPEEVVPAEETAEEPQPEPVEEIVPIEEPEPQPVEEAVEEVSTQPAEESAEEVSAEPAEEPAEEPQSEPVEEIAPVEEPEPQPELEETQPEHCLPVVGVAFRRRMNKIYWFDPDGKDWKKGEVAIFTSPDGVRMEVIVVVEETERAESLFHLPLKPLQKFNA